MKTINATLLANQKVPVGQPYATAALSDNYGMHPTAIVANAWSGGNTIGCECGTFYYRLRYLSTGISVQKITDPTVSAQWAAWSLLVAAGMGTTYGCAIFWTGTYIVICYQDYTVTGSIFYIRSSDGGGSWSAAAVAHAGSPATPINIGGISAGSLNSGLALSYANGLHFRKYNAGADTWSAADGPGIALTDVVPQVAGFYDSINSRYIIAIESNTFTTWSKYAIVLLTRAVGSATWSAGQITFGGNGSHYKGIAFSQRQINGMWWMSFAVTRLWSTSPVSNMMISASNDGLFWQDPLPTVVPGTHISLELLPMPSGGTWLNAYMCTEGEALRHDIYAYWSTSAVMRYHFTSGHGDVQADPRYDMGTTGSHTASQSKLVIQLDNRSGLLTAPNLYSVLTLTRGLLINNVQYGQSAGVWYVTAYRFLLQDQVLELAATDAHGLLASWESHNVFTYGGMTVQQLIEAVCALAGVHTVNFDSYSGWADPVADFAHPAATNAHYTLRALGKRIAFEFIAMEDGSLFFYVPVGSPSAVYTFGGNTGAGEHTIWPGVFGGRDSADYAVFVGGPPRTIVVEEIDNAALKVKPAKHAHIHKHKAITTAPGSVNAVHSLMIGYRERAKWGQFDAPPSFCLEPGDVVNLGAGSAWATSVNPWRVVEFEEHFNNNRQRAFYQKITLRGTTT